MKIGKLILIDKPNKPPGQLQSYRPITLLPAIGKLFEKPLHEQTETPGRGRAIRISVRMFDDPSYRRGHETNGEEQAHRSGSSVGHTGSVRQHQAPPHL